MRLMAATLKVEDATKVALDRLQASLTLKAGKKPTLQELLQELVQLGWTEHDALARRFGGWAPLDDAGAKAAVARLARPHPKEPHEPSRDDLDLYEERS